MKWFVTVVSILFSIQLACTALIEIEKLGCQGRTKKLANLSADIIIGGIIPIQVYLHNKKKYDFNPYGLTWSEAFLYAIEKINADPFLLPDVKLGYDLRNGCGAGEVSMHHTLDFMLDTHYLRNFSDAAMNAKNVSFATDHRLSCSCAGNSSSSFAGVIGAGSSSVSAAISNLLSTDFIPQISYSSTSAIFADKSKYRSFLRTLPSDVYQAQAIADLLQHFNWTYTAVFASDDDYGRLGLDSLRENIRKKGMCLGIDQTFNAKLPRDELDLIMSMLKSKQNIANVVVLWCQESEARAIIQAAHDRGMTNFTWIATETWGTHMNLKELGEKAQGIIGLKLDQIEIPDFRDHLLSRDPCNGTKNEWLLDFFFSLGFCSKAEKDRRDCKACFQYFKPDGSQLPFNKYPFVIAAVYALAHGLHAEFNCQTVTEQSKCLSMK